MNIKRIKNYLLYKTGSKIIVVYNGTRNRRERYCGILLKVYNNVFIIRTNNNNNIKSFNIIDILTKTIQLYI